MSRDRANIERNAEYSAALRVARSIRSDRLEQLLSDRKALVARKQVHDNLQQYLNRLKADPKDAVTAKQLVLLYVMELDAPEKARKYTFLLNDPELKTNVSLANKPADQLNGDEAYTLGKWYHQLAGGVRTTLKGPLLVRSITYFQRFLSLHEAEDRDDLKKTEATLTIKTLEKDLKALGPVASIARNSKAPRASGTRGTNRFTGEPLTLEVERAGTIVPNMKAYKDGDIVYLSIKKRQDGSERERRVAAKGRVLILIQSTKAMAVRLHGHINTPTRGSGNNSFFVTIVPGKKAEASDYVYWEGPTRLGWTWMSVRKPLQLAAGLNTLIIAGREEGAMIDKIRLSPLDEGS